MLLELTHLVLSGFLPASSPPVIKNGAALTAAKETSDALAAVTIALSYHPEAPDKN